MVANELAALIEEEVEDPEPREPPVSVDNHGADDGAARLTLGGFESRERNLVVERRCAVAGCRQVEIPLDRDPAPMRKHGQTLFSGHPGQKVAGNGEVVLDTECRVATARGKEASQQRNSGRQHRPFDVDG